MRLNVNSVEMCRIIMRNEIESRLHRVMIKLDKNGIICPYAVECLSAENCSRCNDFFRKCVKFANFFSYKK